MTASDPVSAERARRQRVRTARGRIVLTFEVDEVTTIEMLISIGRLRREHSDDRDAINAAARAVFESLAVATAEQG